jgi:hypothetical protein
MDQGYQNHVLLIVALLLTSPVVAADYFLLG